MSRVFWDTNLFIYLLEGSGERARRVVSLRERMLARGDQLYTSALTLGEILVKPAEAGDTTLQQEYEQTLSAGAVIVPFDQPAARAYAVSAGTAASAPRMPSSSPAPSPPALTSSSRTMNG